MHIERSLAHAARVETASAHGSAPPPLHERSEQQLQDGLEMTAGRLKPGDLAVLRLVQDAADYMAQLGGTRRALRRIDLSDPSIDQANASGQAAFVNQSAWLGLSVKTTDALRDGIVRLRNTPFDRWTEAQRSSFVAGVETTMHESSHVTLPNYGVDAINGWRRANRAIEEGITQLSSISHLREFMQHEFSVDIPPVTWDLDYARTSYGRAGRYLEGLVRLGGAATPAEQAAAYARLADGVPNELREVELASMIARRVSAVQPSAAQLAALAAAIPALVEEAPGSRTAFTDAVAAIADLRTPDAGGTPDA